MIISTKLTNNMYMFSGKVIGTTSNDVETLSEQVKNDIKSNIQDIVHLNIDMDIESVDDIRSLSQCYLMNLQMLISFQSKVRVEDMVWLIESYLNNLFETIEP